MVAELMRDGTMQVLVRDAAALAVRGTKVAAVAGSGAMHNENLVLDGAGLAVRGFYVSLISFC